MLCDKAGGIADLEMHVGGDVTKEFEYSAYFLCATLQAVRHEDHITTSAACSYLENSNSDFSGKSVKFRGIAG